MYKNLTVLKIKLAKMCSINEPCLVLCDNKHLWPLFADAKKFMGHHRFPNFDQMQINCSKYYREILKNYQKILKKFNDAPTSVKSWTL